MKTTKYFFLILGFFIFLTATTQSVFATSGACSYHGGVNCSAGALINGNAICNDGTESSVSYSAMSECTASVDMCNVTNQIHTSFNYINQNSVTRNITLDTIYQAIKNAQNTLNNDQSSLNSAISNIQDTSTCDAGIQRLEQQRQNALKMGLANSGDESSSFNQMSSSNSVNSQYDQLESQFRQSCNNTTSYYTSSVQIQSNSKIKNDQDCVNNLSGLYDELQKLEGACSTQYGQYAQSSTDNLKTCSCKDGYEWNQGDSLNASGKFCVPITACPPNSTKVGLICQPNAGYIYKYGQFVLDSTLVTASTVVVPQVIVSDTAPTSTQIIHKQVPVKKKNITVSSFDKIATSTIDSSTTIDIGAIPTSTTSDKEMLPSIPPKSVGFWSGLFRAFNPFNWFNSNN